MGRRRRSGNPTSPKTNNSIEDLVGNEENEYPAPDPNRTIINITNKLNDMSTKNLSKRKLWTRSPKHSWRSYKSWLIRKYKMHSRNIKTPQTT
jgi:hypothetical protein